MYRSAKSDKNNSKVGTPKKQPLQAFFMRNHLNGGKPLLY